MMHLLILALVGCESDGLRSGDALAELSDVPPLPSEPAWALRWYGGEGEGLLTACDLIPLEWYEAELTLGWIYAEPPDLTDAPLWLEGDGYRWALGLLVLVNPEMFEPGVVDTESLGEEPGAWGAAEERALLLGEGDLDALLSDLRLEADGDALAESGLWVGMVPELAQARSSLSAAIYPLSDDDRLEQEDEGIRVLTVEWLSEAALEMFSGVGLGGLETECAR